MTGDLPAVRDVRGPVTRLPGVGGPNPTLGTRSIPRSEVLPLDGPVRRADAIRQRLNHLAEREAESRSVVCDDHHVNRGLSF
jgi:hypothetical protein